METPRNTLPRFAQVGPLIVVAGALAAAGVMTLQTPDFWLAGAFLSGGYPTQASVFAFIGVIAWLVVGVAAMAAVIDALRIVVTEAAFIHRRRTQAALCLIAGVTILSVGLARHTAGGFSMCCGSKAEAVQLAQ